ncbi:MAG TPA: hypothetical protein VFX08_02030 [Gaiella sp.]|nr:hypothetical protein [Gaiella sp.]
MADEIAESPKRESVVSKECVDSAEERRTLTDLIECDLSLDVTHIAQDVGRSLEYVELRALRVQLQRIDPADPKLECLGIERDNVHGRRRLDRRPVPGGKVTASATDGRLEHRRTRRLLRAEEKCLSRGGSKRCGRQAHMRLVGVALDESLYLFLVGVEPVQADPRDESIPLLPKTPPAASIDHDDRVG